MLCRHCQLSDRYSHTHVYSDFEYVLSVIRDVIAEPYLCKYIRTIFLPREETTNLQFPAKKSCIGPHSDCFIAITSSLSFAEPSHGGMYGCLYYDSCIFKTWLIAVLQLPQLRADSKIVIVDASEGMLTQTTDKLELALIMGPERLWATLLLFLLLFCKTLRTDGDSRRSLSYRLTSPSKHQEGSSRRSPTALEIKIYKPRR